MAAMEPTNRVDDRLTELEIKASYAEDLVDHLNRLVASQQSQIDRLSHELAQLRRQVAASDQGTTRSLSEDLPPHY